MKSVAFVSPELEQAFSGLTEDELNALKVLGVGEISYQVFPSNDVLLATDPYLKFCRKCKQAIDSSNTLQVFPQVDRKPASQYWMFVGDSTVIFLDDKRTLFVYLSEYRKFVEKLREIRSYEKYEDENPCSNFSLKTNVTADTVESYTKPECHDPPFVSYTIQNAFQMSLDGIAERVHDGDVDDKNQCHRRTLRNVSVAKRVETQSVADRFMRIIKLDIAMPYQEKAFDIQLTVYMVTDKTEVEWICGDCVPVPWNSGFGLGNLSYFAGGRQSGKTMMMNNLLKTYTMADIEYVSKIIQTKYESGNVKIIDYIDSISSNKKNICSKNKISFISDQLETYKDKILHEKYNSIIQDNFQKEMLSKPFRVLKSRIDDYNSIIREKDN